MPDGKPVTVSQVQRLIAEIRRLDGSLALAMVELFDQAARFGCAFPSSIPLMEAIPPDSELPGMWARSDFISGETDT